ncbi:MAG: FAD-dependent oxidoreductase, partial [Alphaproteobacteria bacterium]
MASALIANGVWALASSRRNNRPRGVHALGEPGGESWVSLSDRPYLAADTAPLVSGMDILPGGPGRSGAMPSLPVAGRRVAAAGHVRTEVAVIGGGPAGIAAAIAAADAGSEVVLVERLPVLGGGLLHGRLDPEGRAAPLRRDALVQALAERAGVQVWTGAVCFGLDGDRRLDIWRDGRRTVLRADAVVLATGAIGQRMVFRDNDLPGVIQARTAEQLIHLYGVRPGSRTVVAAAGGVGLGTALTLLDAGVEVPAVLDIEVDPADEPLRRAISARGVPVFRGHTVVAGLPTEGGTRLGAVVAAPAAGPDRIDSAALRIMCESLCVGIGWHPALDLAIQARAQPCYDPLADRLAVKAMPPGILLAGAAAGVAEIAAAELDGLAAGEAAVRGTLLGPRVASRPNLAWPLVDDVMRRGSGSDYVDRAGELTRQNLAERIAEGVSAPGDLGERRGDPSEVATLHRLFAGGPETVPDPHLVWMPADPAAALTLGDLADPPGLASRRGPLDRVHRSAGALMQGFGSWLMPASFASSAAAVEAEARAVRGHIGLMDRSDLGKAIVSGADAALLLNRVLTGRPAELPAGQARLTRPRESWGRAIGAVVVARLGDEDFLLTTYPDRAESLVSQLRHATQPGDRVVSVDTTAAHAVVAVAGPNASTLLGALGGPAAMLADAATGFAVGATRI